MSNKIIGYIIQCNTNNSIYYIGKKREIYFSSLGSVKIFKSKNGIKSAINKLQQLNPNYNYKIKNIYKTTKISSYYYKEKMIQNNKSMLMLSNNKQGINNNIHNKRIVLLKK